MRGIHSSQMEIVKGDKLQTSFFAIGIYKPKTAENIGSLWRTAYILGAQYIFLIDKRYTRQATDVLNVWSRIPLFQFKNFDEFYNAIPYNSRLVGVEMDDKAVDLKDYEHPRRGIYVLGAEDGGLPKEYRDRCHSLVKLPGNFSLNVAVTGSVVLYDRISKTGELPR